MYKGISFAVIAVLLLTHLSYGQQSVLDSLRAVAETSKDDTVRAKALNGMAWLLAEDNPEESLRKGFEALKLAQGSANIFIEADCYKSIGVAYDIKGDIDSCIYYLSHSLTLYKQLHNEIKQSNVLSDIAIGYFGRGIYELALKNHFLALQLREKANDSLLLGKSYNNIGLVYKNRNDFQKAIEYYQKSLKIKTLLKDEPGMLNTTMNLGSLYQTRLIYDSALFYAQNAYVLAVKINRPQDIAAALGNKGVALSGMKKMEESLKMLKEAEKQAVASNCKICFPAIYTGLGNYYMAKLDYATAAEYFTTGMINAKSNGRQELLKSFYRLLSECYFKNGAYKIAYLYKDSADKTEAELLNKENLRQMNEMSAVYETVEKEKQIEKLNNEAIVSSKLANQRKKERNYFVIASILFLLLAGLLFKAFQSNRKKKNQLNNQNTIIEKSLAEKEILMKEIHHRVKNNLQVISSLLNLQSSYIKDEQAQDAVKESRNRVQSMALIHQNLYQEENLTEIDVSEYIGKLCDNLFSSYNINPQKIKLIRDIQPLMMDVDIVIPIGLILNELISNSLKYAFTGSEKEGVIRVALKETAEGLRLEVYDNGAGFPDDLNLKTNHSFGYKMINSFLQKLEGDIKMNTEDGARVEVTISKYKKQQHE